MRRIHTRYVFLAPPFVLNFSRSKFVSQVAAIRRGAWVVPSHFFAFVLAREALPQGAGPVERRVPFQGAL
jgi:hypothetical protein